MISMMHLDLTGSISMSILNNQRTKEKVDKNHLEKNTAEEKKRNTLNN